MSSLSLRFQIEEGNTHDSVPNVNICSSNLFVFFMNIILICYRTSQTFQITHIYKKVILVIFV
jgi:hypothetical protein